MVMPTKPRGFRVYKATNKITGGFYIGVTKLLLSKRRNLHHSVANGKNNTRLSQAIVKYGFDNFEFSELYLFQTRREAWDMEIMMISELNPHYNVDAGGPGSRHALGKKQSKQVREKLSASQKQVWKRDRGEKAAASIGGLKKALAVRLEKYRAQHGL